VGKSVTPPTEADAANATLVLQGIPTMQPSEELLADILIAGVFYGLVLAMHFFV